MVNDAEKYKAEDETQKERISAKNALESYAFNMKSTVEDDKLKDKIPADDMKTIMDKCNEVSQHPGIRWFRMSEDTFFTCIFNHYDNNVTFRK